MTQWQNIPKAKVGRNRLEQGCESVATVEEAVVQRLQYHCTASECLNDGVKKSFERCIGTVVKGIGKKHKKEKYAIKLGIFQCVWYYDAL